MRRFWASAVVVGGSQQRLLWRKLRERGAGFLRLHCAAWQMRSFLSMMATKAARVVSSKSARVIYFLGKLGWRLPYDVMVPWESSFILLLSTTKRKTDAGGRGRRTPRHKDNNKNKTARNLNDSLNVSLNIDYVSIFDDKL